MLVRSELSNFEFTSFVKVKHKHKQKTLGFEVIFHLEGRNTGSFFENPIKLLRYNYYNPLKLSNIPMLSELYNTIWYIDNVISDVV